MWDLLFCVALIVFGYALGSSVELGITQHSFDILCQELDILRNGKEEIKGGSYNERDDGNESDDD